MTVGKYYEEKDFSIMHMVDDELAPEGFTLHMHDRYELYCLVRGDVGYVVEGNAYELTPGSIMLMRSAETHKLLVRGGGEYERSVIYITPDFFASHGLSSEMLAPFTERGLGERNLYRPEEMSGAPPLFYIKKIFRERVELPLATVFAANISALLCDVYMAFCKGGEAPALTASEAGRALLAYVNANITENITLESVAAHAHMSKSQVGRVFRGLTGASVYDYIISKRLILAQERIAKGENASSAASACGFRDYSSFYRLYKKRFGSAPTEARVPYAAEAKDGGKFCLK